MATKNAQFLATMNAQKWQQRRYSFWQQLYSPQKLEVNVTKYKGQYLNLTTDGL